MGKQTDILLFGITVAIILVGNSWAVYRLYKDKKGSYLLFVIISYISIFLFIALNAFGWFYVYDVTKDVSMDNQGTIMFIVGILELLYGIFLLLFISKLTKKHPSDYLVKEKDNLYVSFGTNMVTGAMRTHLAIGYCWFFLGSLAVLSFLKIGVFLLLIFEGWFILVKMVSIVEKHTQKRLEKLGILVDGQLVEDKGVNHE